MSRRERVLAIVLLPLMLIVGGGVMAYQFWYLPLRQRDRLINEVSDEIAAREAKVKQIRAEKDRLAKLRQISLPLDADMARREYEEELAKLLRASGFDGGSFSIIPKPPESKSSPTLANKKPIYTRLLFTVTAKGDLAALIDFLDRFYRLRLLHQVRNLSIQRPLTPDRNRANDLDVNLTIEALVLDTAEPRKTLVPEKTPDLAPLLARADEQYATIAGKNVFFGPPPPPPPEPQRPPSLDMTQFIRCDGILDGEKGRVATLYDAYTNNDILIRPRLDGDGFRVEVRYLLNGRKRTLRSGKMLDVQDDQGELQRSWDVVKIAADAVYLREEGAVYELHVGQRLNEMRRLSAEEVKQLDGASAAPEPAAKAAGEAR